MADTVIVHPNRDKPESNATKAAVVLLLVTSAALIAIITIGGWAQLQGAQIVAVAYVLIYAVMAYFVVNWNRGVLPVASGMAVLFAVVAAVAAPAWFSRDKPGLVDPALDSSILGLLTLILIPVQLLLIAFAMRGFQQKWNVEVEVSREAAERGRPRDFDEGEPQTA
jgi:presenilin-like A22 family membrane protease